MIIIFEYYDEYMYYFKLLKKGGEELNSELNSLWENMQNFLDEEIVKINGERVRPVVDDVFVAIRGDARRPYVEYLISFPAPLKKGVNTYENYYEEEVAEYDYEATWILPKNAKILSWEMGGRVETPEPYILRILVNKGVRVGGREGFIFELS